MKNVKWKLGSIVGFDGLGVWFRTLKGEKCMSLLNRARQDGSGQPCIMFVEEVDEESRESSNDD